MRVYGTIYSAFWNNETMSCLPDDAKLLALFLLTSDHGNLIGCFRLPLGYIAEDLRWTKERVTNALANLQEEKFLIYDHKLSWLIICNYLKWNPIANPNQGRSVENIFLQVPNSSIFYQTLIASVLAQTKHLSDEFINRLETLSKPFLNQEQEQDKEQEQKQIQNRIDMSGKPDVDTLFEFHSEKNSTSGYEKPNRYHQALEILEFLNQKTGRVYRPVSSNLKLIITCLKSGATIEQCRQVIAKKCREWKKDPKMIEFLRPATLFNPVKFEQYLGELVLPNRACDEANS